MTILNNFKRRLALFIGANKNNATGGTPSSTETPRGADFYDMAGNRLRAYSNEVGYSSPIEATFNSSYVLCIPANGVTSISDSGSFISQCYYITEDFNIIDNEYPQPVSVGHSIKTLTPSRTYQNNIEMGKNGLTLTYTNSAETTITVYGFYAFTLLSACGYYNGAWQSNGTTQAPLIAVKFDQPVTLEAGKTITTIYDIDFSNI